MRELLVTKPLEYAASKTSSAADAATSPEMLAEGAIGIYYITKSTGAPTLIPAGTPTLAAAISATGLPVSKIQFIFALGTATSVEITEGVSSEFIQSVIAKEYALGVKQTWYIGFNGTIGDFNTPSTINNYDEAGIEIFARRLGTNVQDDFAIYNASLALNDTKFNIASKLCDAVNIVVLNPKALAEVNTEVLTADDAIAGASTTITFVKNSNVVTTSGTFSQAITTGDYLQVSMVAATNLIQAVTPTVITGVTYKVLNSTAGVVTLDRAYSGESQVLPIASIAGLVRSTVAPVSVGVRVTSLDALTAIDVSTYGVISINRTNTNPTQGATRTLGVAQSLGSGTTFLMQKLESQLFIEAGNYQTLDATIPKAVSKINTSAGYDTYQLKYKKGTGLDGRNIENDIYFAFEDGTYTGTKAQVIFDTLIKLITGVNQTTVSQVTNSVRGGGTAAS